MSLRRMLPFILLNIVVSAAVVLGILFWWDSRNVVQSEFATNTAESAAIQVVQTAARASTTPSITDTPEPPPEQQIHVVSAGDTLLSLSEFYDVPMQDIMLVNEISNPNVLSVGQELIIPIGGIPTATPLATSLPEDADATPPTPIATQELIAAGEPIVIISAATGAGDVAQEAIQITNAGASQVALLDWQLLDEDGHIYTFGQVTLFGDGAAIELHTAEGEAGPADLYWGLEVAIWESGEQVTLLDSEQTERATFIVP